jgi:hypothetical protein
MLCTPLPTVIRSDFLPHQSITETGHEVDAPAAFA